MVAAMVGFTINDTCMKAATADLPVFQAIVLRGLLTTLALAVYGLASGAIKLPRGRADRTRLAVRTVAEVSATFAFLLALKHMPLANLSAILQFLPLAVTLGAALILGETIGWRRMTAILVGFVGVMTIIRPGSDGFDRWSVLGMVSMSCVVVRDLATRGLSGHVSSVTVALAAALAVTVGGALVLPFAGVMAMTLPQGLQIAGASTFLIVGYLTGVMATRTGDIAMVAPFRYASLVAAIVLGWAVFGQFPDRWTLIGGATVVATGIYTFYRERTLAREALVPVAAD